MKVVSDTGPLIALAKARQLQLLEQLFGEIFIPPAVYREILAKTGPEAEQLDSALATFVRVAEHPSVKPEVRSLTSHLDRGEREAIALTCQLNALLLVDDRLGRQAAQRLNLLFTGVAGILIKAKEKGLLPHVRPVLEQIRSQGYWLSDELLDLASRLANED